MTSKKQMDAMYEKMREAREAFDRYWENETDPQDWEDWVNWFEDQCKQTLEDLDLPSAVIQNPIFQNFIHQNHSVGYSPSLKQPWRAEGERLMYLFGLSAPWLFDFEFGPGHPLNNNYAARAPMVLNLHDAQTYLWRDEIRNKAEQLPVPRHTIPENMLPHAQMYWAWENCHELTLIHQVSGQRAKMDVDALFVHYQPPKSVMVYGMALGGYEEKPDRPRVTMPLMGELRMGSTWPDDYTEMEQEKLGPVLASLSFLNSPYISLEKHRLPRPMRRALIKGAFKHTDPLINVVELRSVATPHNGTNESDRTYHRQWWVKAHIRAQWYPSMKGHQLIWIQEHLKGPENAPMAQKVYDVKR